MTATLLEKVKTKVGLKTDRLKVFVLDDEIHLNPRNAILGALKSHSLTVAVSRKDAQAKFAGPYDLILLDHDMRGFYESSDVEHSGFQFLKWLLGKDANALAGAKVIVHSQNSVGRANMRKLMLEHGVEAQEFHFGQTYVDHLKETYAR